MMKDDEARPERTTTTATTNDHSMMIDSALRSLGTTVASSATYEASVLRDATLSSAPTLTGATFPDLRDLTTTTATTSGDVHRAVRRVLRRIRSQISDTDESRKANVARIKVRILSEWLRTTEGSGASAKDDEEGYDPRSEAVSERRRSAALRERSSSSTSKVESVETQHRAFSSSKNKSDAKERRAFTKLSRAKRLEEIKNGRFDVSDDDDNENDRGSRIFLPSSSFGKQVLLERARDRAAALSNRRTSIMKIKKRLEEASVMDDIVLESLVRERRQRRKERRDRRRRRKALLDQGDALNQRNDSTGDEKEEEDEVWCENDGSKTQEQPVSVRLSSSIKVQEKSETHELSLDDATTQNSAVAPSENKIQNLEGPDGTNLDSPLDSINMEEVKEVDENGDISTQEPHRLQRQLQNNQESKDSYCDEDESNPPTLSGVIDQKSSSVVVDENGPSRNVLSFPTKKQQKTLEIILSKTPDSATAKSLATKDTELTVGTSIDAESMAHDNNDTSSRPTTSIEGEDGLSCPVCGRVVKLPNGMDDVDAALALHIDSCQRTGPRRGGRRRTRSAVNYNEDDKVESAVVATESNTVEKPKERVSSRKRKQPQKRELSTKSKRRPAPVQGSAPTPASAPVPVNHSIDDFELDVYSDRVEEWIDHGPSHHLPPMPERDATESPPGVAVHPGGLVVPAWINDRLFPYQRTGVRWLWELHRQEAGGVVGDEMGLGKTVQVCAFLGSLAASRKMDGALIVAPATLLRHWLRELARWSPGLRRVLLHGSGVRSDGYARDVGNGRTLAELERWLRAARERFENEPMDEREFQNVGDGENEDEDDELFEEHSFVGTGYVVVTTYENIRSSADVWSSHHFSYVILDEGQKIKNPEADVTLTCKRFKTPHRLLLSGTPIQNDLRELWSLFDFVFPGRLGTLPTFETEFAEPIKKGGYSNASVMQVQFAYRCALVLRDLINPYMLRRLKKNISECSRMPGKTEQILFCRLTPTQRAMYKSYLASDEVARVVRGSDQSFRAITNLRKICNHPELYGVMENPVSKTVEIRNRILNEQNGVYLSSSSSSEDEMCCEDDDKDPTSVLVERSGKLEVLAKILPLWRAQGHRVLLFCQWRKMLNIVQKLIVAKGWRFSRLDGNTTVGSRQQMVDTFNNDPTIFIMLMTTKTGGVGLNLTGADRIILYDPDWNPQTDAQARERSWRFGQKKQVTIYRLITAGTIEEKIYHRQIFKTAMSNQVLQDPKQRRLFTRKDLTDLFTLKEDNGSVISGTGVTETGQITKGAGVINAENMGKKGKQQEAATNNESKDERDNTNTLSAVLRSKGLAGVFEHDALEIPDWKKSHSVLEMESMAKDAAAKAAKVLEESVSKNNTMKEDDDSIIPVAKLSKQRNNSKRASNNVDVEDKATQPTNEKNRNRFGYIQHNDLCDDGDEMSPDKFDCGFGGANSAGIGKSLFGSGGSRSSSSILEKFRREKENTKFSYHT